MVLTCGQHLLDSFENFQSSGQRGQPLIDDLHLFLQRLNVHLTAVLIDVVPAERRMKTVRRRCQRIDNVEESDAVRHDVSRAHDGADEHCRTTMDEQLVSY